MRERKRQRQKNVELLPWHLKPFNSKVLAISTQRFNLCVARIQICLNYWFACICGIKKLVKIKFSVIYFSVNIKTLTQWAYIFIYSFGSEIHRFFLPLPHMIAFTEYTEYQTTELSIYFCICTCQTHETEPKICARVPKIATKYSSVERTGYGAENIRTHRVIHTYTKYHLRIYN